MSTGLDCPVPHLPSTIQLAHGGGGRMMRRLIQNIFYKIFANPELLEHHDSAVLDLGSFGDGRKVAITTDAYVVSPLFFPGGDIGRLAVVGTVNDLAMAGARPSHLTASFILEEGLAMDTLERIAASMRAAADESGVRIVAGDTKVVDRGKGDGVFISTSGVGIIPANVTVAPRRVLPGDVVLVSGDLGRHGIAILSVREGLAFEAPIESDCAPLHECISALQSAGVDLHCARDLTRGGLSAALNEIAEDAGVHIAVNESFIPVSEPVSGACEMLGLDPLYVACEGRMALFVAASDAERAVAVLRSLPVSSGATIIGNVTHSPAGSVSLKTRLGGTRTLDLLSGEQLPRIC